MGWESIQPLFNWLAEHTVLAAVFIFLIAFAESLLIVGLLVPGTILMFGVGTLVGAGALQFWDTIIIAFFGAVCGDAVSFLIGKHYHHHVVKLWPFKDNPDYLQKGEKFFHKHGGKSILFGRFVGPVRPIIPAVAGMMDMSQSYFFFVNVLSAAGWAPFYLIPGIVFGSSLELAAEIGARLVILLLLSIVIVLVISWIFKKMYLAMLPWFQRQCMAWYQNTAISRSLLDLLLDENAVIKRGAFLLSSSCILLFIFSLASIVNLRIAGEGMVDLVIARTYMLVQSFPISEFYAFLLLSIGWSSLVFLLLNFTLLSLYFKQRLLTLRFIAIILISSGALFLISVLKVIVGIETLIFSHELSSQIKVSVICVSVLLVIKLADIFFMNARKLFITGVALVSVAILLNGFLYFQVLTFSGLILSVSFTALIAIIVLWGVESEVQKPFAKILATSSLVLLGLFSTLSIDERGLKSDSVSMITELDQAVWLADAWQTRDVKRIGILGESRERFDIQWLGSADEIEKALMDDNWIRVPDLDLRSVLMWINTSASLSSLGNLPSSHRGKSETFALQKYYSDLPESRLLLKFYKQDDVTVSGKSLWLVSLSLRSLAEPDLLTAKTHLEQNDKLITDFFMQQRSNWQGNFVTFDDFRLGGSRKVLLFRARS